MSITILSSMQAAPTTASRGASSTDPAQPAALDFSALLGAGLEPGVDVDALAALPGQPPTAAATDKPALVEESGDEAAAILDAIAAAQGADTKSLSAGAPVPILPAMAPVAAPPAASSGKPVAQEDAAVPSGAGARPARTLLQAADSGHKDATQSAETRAEPTLAKFEPMAVAARQNSMPERGAAGELRAEILAKSVPDSQAATHLLHTQHPRHAGEATTVRLETLQQQVGTPGWNDGLANRVVWMAKSEVQTAELHLNPADLGPIEVTLTLSGDDKSQATVQFSAAHAATREAIETALPRLREMLQESGITLGQAGVDANNSHAADGGGEQASGRGNSRTSTGTSDAAPAAGVTTNGTTRSQGRGLVDTFA